MRLTDQQVRTILATVRREADPGARVVLFGSRVDESRRGGDVDLLIESPVAPTLWQRARIKTVLEEALQLPVDVLGKQSGAAPTPFQAIALMTGTELGVAP